MCAALGVEKTPPFFMHEIFVILLLQTKNSMDFSPFLQKAQNDKFLVITCNEPLNLVILPFLSYRQSPCHIDLFRCHTERNEVSINLKCKVALLRRILNSVDFSLTLKMTMEIFAFLQKAQSAVFASGFLLWLCLATHWVARFTHSK